MSRHLSTIYLDLDNSKNVNKGELVLIGPLILLLTTFFVIKDSSYVGINVRK